jgi:DNA-binding transcriptional regulator YdaS (Cro superfamily)
MTKSKHKIKPIVNKAEIARRIGLSKQYVGQLLNGKRHNAARIREIESVIHSELHNFKRTKAA